LSRKRRQISPVHPGEILNEEFLKPLGATVNSLALGLRVPSNRLYAIVEGSRGISADTALRLARYFGTSAEFWMNLQSRYDLELARGEVEEAIKEAVRPLKQSDRD
jgi:addiction module HigA family antidote